MTVFIEGKHREEFLLTEARGSRSRETLLFSSSVLIGQICGKLETGAQTLTITSKVGNTGNGTVVADPIAPGLPGAADGEYDVVFTSATVAEVSNPAGDRLGELTLVGGTGAFSDEIKVTGHAGATAFVAGDSFKAVLFTNAGEETYVPLSLTATDGSQNPAVIPIDNVTVLSGPVAGVAMVRDCEVMGLSLTYPAGATATQITEINEQLGKKGVIVRYPQGTLVSA